MINVFPVLRFIKFEYLRKISHKSLKLYKFKQLILFNFVTMIVQTFKIQKLEWTTFLFMVWFSSNYLCSISKKGWPLTSNGHPILNIWLKITVCFEAGVVCVKVVIINRYMLVAEACYFFTFSIFGWWYEEVYLRHRTQCLHFTYCINVVGH